MMKMGMMIIRDRLQEDQNEKAIETCQSSGGRRCPVDRQCRYWPYGCMIFGQQRRTKGKANRKCDAGIDLSAKRSRCDTDGDGKAVDASACTIASRVSGTDRWSFPILSGRCE